MDDLLKCLGWPVARRAFAGLFLLFLAAGAGWIALFHVVSLVTGIGLLTLHVAAWPAWFFWQGRLFPAHRRRDLREHGDDAYRHAFWHDIFPGVTFGAAQMVRPLTHGVIEKLAALELPVSFSAPGVLGSLLFADGVLLLVLGFATIGPAAAGFVYEYRPSVRPIKERSIYSCIRHPLFLGGALVSFGGSLVLGVPSLVAIGLVNILVLPVYGAVEDYRLSQSFGEQYESYAAAVNRFIPRPRSVRTSVPAIIDDAWRTVSSVAMAIPRRTAS